jgi:hypothetical protein
VISADPSDWGLAPFVRRSLTVWLPAPMARTLGGLPTGFAPSSHVAVYGFVVVGAALALTPSAVANSIAAISATSSVAIRRGPCREMMVVARIDTPSPRCSLRFS